MAEALVDTKQCNHCGLVLPVDDFHRVGRGRRRPECKKCRKVYSDEYRKRPEVKEYEKSQKAQYYLANKEHINQRIARYREKNPDVGRKAVQRWQERNPEYREQYYLKNRDRILAQNAAWLAANPDWARAKRNRRRAMISGKSVPYTAQQLRERMSMYDGTCYLCADTATAVDHVKPLTRGGWDCLSNLRPICGPCNSKKHNKWPYAPVVALLQGGQ